jgi:hypothetical protein
MQGVCSRLNAKAFQRYRLTAARAIAVRSGVEALQGRFHLGHGASWYSSTGVRMYSQILGRHPAHAN